MSEQPPGDPPAPPSEHGRGQMLGRYVVLGTLGTGGQGVVLAAYDTELDRKVALKLPAKSATDAGSTGELRLLREAKALARLNHPHVVAVHDAGTIDNQVFIAMELVEGETLKAWLYAKPRSWRAILSMMAQAGRGLAAAHGAGLVHRDFKPENVLIGLDGRARVTDFGLAKRAADDVSEDPAPWPSPAGAVGISSDLTQQGTLTGTASYMAPEQYQGVPPDARSDQFSFCAAMYRALYRTRPFDPMQVGARIIQEPPHGHGVPAWLRRLVMRGLSVDPAHRFASMDELISGIDRRTARSRWRWPVAAVALAVVAVSSVTAAIIWDRRGLCTSSQARAREVWDASIAAKVQSAFLATGKPHAGQMFSSVRDALDSYSARWAQMHQEACVATRVRGEQSEALMQRRMVCLDRRLKDLGALARTLQTAQSRVVDRATEAAASLPSLAPCAESEALTAKAALPEDAALRVRIDRLESQLSEAKALHATGRFKEALELSDQVVPDAERIGYWPLLGEALYQQGLAEERTGKPELARTNLERAAAAADEGHDDVLRAMIAMALVGVNGVALAQREPAELWMKLAYAMLHRVGSDPELEAFLENVAGVVCLRHKEFKNARPHFERSLQLLERQNPNHWRRPHAMANLGRAYWGIHDYPKAIAILQQTISTVEQGNSPHPALAWAYRNLASVYVDTGQLELAVESGQRAIELFSGTAGPEHPDVANALNIVAEAYRRLGKYAPAMASYRQSVAIHERAVGPENPDLAPGLTGMGETLLLMGQAKDALVPLERAMPLWGGDHAGRGAAAFAIAKAAWSARRDVAQAQMLAGTALEAFTLAGESGKVDEVRKWTSSLK